jgi:hypothetical protein
MVKKEQTKAVPNRVIVLGAAFSFQSTAIDQQEPWLDMNNADTKYVRSASIAAAVLF